MAVLIDHQDISVNPGTRSFETSISNPQTILLRLARKTTATPTYWADGVQVVADVEYSTDGGSTWHDLAGFVAEGGIIPNRTGGELAETKMQCPFPSATNRARISVVVSGGTLVSQLTVESV